MNFKYFIYILIPIFVISLYSCCNSVEAQNTYKTVYLDSSKSFFSQIKKTRTRYVVLTEYDLNGEEVNMPRNSILEFRGGLLRNGVLHGKKNTIISSAEKIFDESVSLDGNWSNTEFLPEWFGAKGDGVHDDTEPFQRAINSGSIIALSKTYKVYHLIINKSISIKGGCLKAFLDEYGNTRNLLKSNGKFDITFWGVGFDGSGYKLANKGNLEPMLSINGSKKVVFEKCTIHHHSQNSGLPDEKEWQKRRCYALSILGAKDVVLDGCDFHDNLSEQIAIGSNTTYNSRRPVTILKIKNCTSHNNKKSLALFLLFELKSAIIHDNVFKDNGRTFFNLMTDNVSFYNNKLINTNSRGITSESQGNYYSVNNVIIDNNEIKNAKEGLISVGNKNVIITNNIFENDSSFKLNEYLIRVGGVFTGSNTISQEAKEALPYYDNSFMSSYKGKNILIEGNVILGYAKRAGIGVRVAENINLNNQVDTLGNINNISIKNNEIRVTNGYPIYFPNGKYTKISINNNAIYSATSSPIVYFSPSSVSKSVKSFVSDFSFIDNDIYYISGDFNENVIVCGYGTVEKTKIKNNLINKTPTNIGFQILYKK